MSKILRRLRGRTKHSARSDKDLVTSSNGPEALPQLPAGSGRAHFRKTGGGKRLILIGAGILCIGIIARFGYHLLWEGTPTTDNAVVEGYTYPVSSRIDGTIAGILISNRQYVKAGDLLAEIDKRDLEPSWPRRVPTWFRHKQCCLKLRRSFPRLKQSSRQQNRGCLIAQSDSLKPPATTNTSQKCTPGKVFLPCSSREQKRSMKARLVNSRERK